MNNDKWAALLFVLIFGVANLLAVGSGDVVKRSFTVNKGGMLVVDSDLGSVQVSSWSNKKVEVAIEIEMSDEIRRHFKLDFQQDGDMVEITGVMEKKLSWFSGRKQVTYKIKVPDEFNIKVKTSGGSVSVGGVKGEVETVTSGGSLHFNDISGPVLGQTSGGSIDLLKISGDANIRTSGGSIRMEDVEGDVEAKTSGGSLAIANVKGMVTAHTSGGSIKIDDVRGGLDVSTSGGGITARLPYQPAKDCKMKTSGGSIHVQMAPDVTVLLDARTSGSSVKSDFEIAVKGEIKRGKLKGKINGGGPLVYLRTSGGGIYLEKL
ncbi:MAG: DUF4097 family beta strand repeat-containing protein [Calditrichia bacterium]